MRWLTDLADPACPLELSAGRAELPHERLGPRRLDLHVRFLVLDGRYEGEDEGRPVHAGQGDLLWLPAGRPHLVASTRPVRKYFIRLRTQAAIPIEPPLVRRTGEESLVWCRELVAEQHPVDVLGQARTRALAILLVSAWVRARARPAGGLDPERRARLLQLVTADPARRWRRAELATALGVSGLHLARMVRRSFGVPLRSWLVETRIRAAANELREYGGTIGELAGRYGYDEIFLFSRQFRRIMGVGPRRWRQDGSAAG